MKRKAAAAVAVTALAASAAGTHFSLMGMGRRIRDAEAKTVRVSAAEYDGMREIKIPAAGGEDCYIRIVDWKPYGTADIVSKNCFQDSMGQQSVDYGNRLYRLVRE